MPIFNDRSTRSSRSLPRSLGIALAASLALSLASVKSSQASDIVARIGDFELTRSKLDAMWQSLAPGHRAVYERGGGGKAAYLDDFIRQKIVAVRAEQLGYGERPEIIAALENAHNSILGRALVEAEVTDKIVTDEAMRQYYADHEDGFKVPTKLSLRHIVVTPHRERKLSNSTGDDATDDAQAKTKIERLLKDLENGGDFMQLAAEWSEDLTAEKGGLLDDFARGRMSRSIEEAAFALEEGQRSGIIQTPYGYHIVKLEKRYPERIPPFEELRERIKVAVAQERRDSFQPRLEQMTEELRAKLGVEVIDPNLRYQRPAPPEASETASGTQTQPATQTRPAGK